MARGATRSQLPEMDVLVTTQATLRHQAVHDVEVGAVVLAVAARTQQAL
jgi:hypothetical protein